MLGKAVPDLSLPSTAGSTFRPTKERGRKLALYFYPTDSTPVAPRRALRFATMRKAKMQFPFELLSVIKLKNMYGRKVRGIERSTFLVNEEGVVAREWRGVKVPGHVQEVLNFVKAL